MTIKEPFLAEPEHGDSQPTPFYRRRSVQVGGGALLTLITAGGLFAGLHSSSKGNAGSATNKSPRNEAITPKPNSSSASSSSAELQPATNVNVATDLCNSATSTIIQKIMSEQVTCSHDATSQDSFGPNVLSFFTKWNPVSPTNPGDQTVIELIDTSKDDQMKQAIYSLASLHGETETIDGNECRIDSSHQHFFCLLAKDTTAIVLLPVSDTSLEDYTQVMKSAIESAAQ